MEESLLVQNTSRANQSDLQEKQCKSVEASDWFIVVSQAKYRMCVSFFNQLIKQTSYVNMGFYLSHYASFLFSRNKLRNIYIYIPNLVFLIYSMQYVILHLREVRQWQCNV